MTPDDPSHADLYAKSALALMQKHSVAPTPVNYGVWYHYAMGNNKELMHEVDTLVKNALPFTPETSAYLHNKYLVVQNTKKVDETAVSAQNVLSEVLKVITEFGGETKSYNKGVDETLTNLTQKFEDTAVKDIVKDLVQATANLKKQGESLHKKLEDSTTEINNLKKNLQQVTTESQHDFLTGAFNRKTFEAMFDEQCAHAKEKKTPLCLLMIDIDYFKKFNDKFGHLLGDEVLKIVARTLMDTLKGRDVVARFGGEEFVAILPETPLDGAMKVADMIRKTIASKELKRKDTGESYGNITVSMGIAHFRPESDTLPTLIKRADDALYKSKHAGRNRVTLEH